MQIGLVARRVRSIAVSLALVAGLAACGGGGGQDDGSTPEPPPVAVPLSDAEAARFLTQATFGPTEADINVLKPLGYRAWLDQQMALPSSSHRVYMDNRLVQLRLTQPTATLNANHFYESFWSY